ncbi:MAG: nucleotidyltransferase family protein [Chitinophagales bacterium]|nr:nucleotidyltransferase family protein [Chitinophagales bacterium]
MPVHYSQHLINKDVSIKDVLMQLNTLASDAILFVVDEGNKLLGSLTDGDIRRGLIRGLDMQSHVLDFVQEQPKYIQQGRYDLQEIVELRKKFFNVFPVVNDEHKIINVVNFRHQISYLPVDALIMAGGRGERLKPLTDTTPKPLLPIGGKPIIERNVDRFKDYGIDDIWISLRYLGEQIENYFQDGSEKSLRIQYVYEKDPLGTIGALKLVSNWMHDTVLVMNSDLLTNINFEDFYLFFKENEADFAVACVPYKVNIPYAVMETQQNVVTGFKEKPTYTHYSNAGIYLMKKEIIDLIPTNEVFNATDLMETLLAHQKRVISYPLVGYWLDIGKHEDYKKANEEIKQIKF